MSITPRPITASDHVDQSRDTSGFRKWSRSSRIVEFIMLILGWFTTPVEVFLRRDFGQRWFTTVNFYAGLMLLLMFATLQYLISLLWEWLRNLMHSILSSVNPLYIPEEYDLSDRLMDSSMVFIIIAYILMGTYHLFKIWWRNKANLALHSFSDGTSRLEPVAAWLMQILNILTDPLVKLFLLLVPKRQRIDIPQPSLINDKTAFANTILEPLLLLILAIKLHGIVSLWLFISAVTLAIHASWRETAKLNKILDFRDSILDAKTMMQLRSETQHPTVQQEMIMQAATTLQDAPQITSRMEENYPDLMDIIEEMNGVKTNRN